MPSAANYPINFLNSIALSIYTANIFVLHCCSAHNQNLLKCDRYQTSSLRVNPIEIGTNVDEVNIKLLSLMKPRGWSPKYQ